MIFIAVDLGLEALAGLKIVCFGLCGALSYVLAALPLWAGFLVIWSTQRRAPVRPWVFAVLSLVGICTFIMLISGGAMTRLTQNGNGTWGGVVGAAFNDCSRTGVGGGALGVVLGWPLWTLVRAEALWAVLFFLLTLFCLLMMVNLTPSRIRELVTGQAANRRSRQEDGRAQAEAPIPDRLSDASASGSGRTAQRRPAGAGCPPPA